MADAPEPAPTAGASRRIDSDVPEPRLNYRRLEAGVQELLQDHELTAICVSDKVLALGTQQGSVHILDPVAGTEVRRFQDHRGAVLDLSFDASVEFCASSSEDGTVRVRGIFSDESFEGRYNRPVQTVALDPRYASRKTKEFVAGTAAGQLCLASQGWLGKKDVVLHSGEGSQLALAWSGPLIAFATEVGVRIYDTSVHRRIAFLPRPSDPVPPPPPPPLPDCGADSAAAHAEPVADAGLATSCQLHWGDATLLYIAWPWAVQVARVMVQQEVLQGPGLQQGSYNASREVQLVASASTEFVVAGIAPFGPDIAVLGYPPAALPAGVAQEEAAGGAMAPRHAEMCIVSRAGEMLASHPVPLHSAGPAGAGACRLACWCTAADALRILDAAGGSSSSRAQPGSAEEQQLAPAAAPVSKWWREGLEPQYYVMAGKELLVGRPLDVEERLAWLTDHHAWQRALAVLDTEPASISAACREKVVQRYLEHLVGTEKKYEQAAADMPKLLRDNAALWERWVGEFANCRQLPQLAQYLPTASPRLAATAYDMVLRSFLPFEANHGALLQVVSSWPSSLYSVKLLIDRVTARLRMMAPQDGQAGGLLKEVLAKLYQLEGRPDLAMNILLKLGRRDVFEFIERFHLHHHLRTKVVLLLRIDEEQAVAMLVAHHDLVPPSVVVTALQQQMAAAEQQATTIEAGIWHFRLFRYLHELFRRAPFAAPSHHSLQVKLYADYSPKDLMNFLVTSQSYQLEHALEVCRSHKLVSEQVYILGRMGSSEKAVRLIITQLRDVAQAVAFVAQQDDPELWALLISLAVTDPEMAGQLLDHVGLHINPELVLKRIPQDMGIPRLRSRLAKILADMKSGIALRQGCSNVLMSDSISLSAHLYSAARRRFPRLYLFMDAPSPAAAAGTDGPAEADAHMAAGNGCQWFLFNGQAAAPSVMPTRPPALLSPCVHVRAAATALGPQLAEPGRDGADVPDNWRPGPESVDGVVVGLELEEGDDSLSDAVSTASAATATPPTAASHGCASTSPGRRLGTPGRAPHDVHDGLRQGRGLHGSGGSGHGKRPLALLITP